MSPPPSQNIFFIVIRISFNSRQIVLFATLLCIFHWPGWCVPNAFCLLGKKEKKIKSLTVLCSRKCSPKKRRSCAALPRVMNQDLRARLTGLRLEGNSSRIRVPSEKDADTIQPRLVKQREEWGARLKSLSAVRGSGCAHRPVRARRELQSDVGAYLGFLAAGTSPPLLLSIPRCVVGCLRAARRSALHIKATWLCLSFPKAGSLRGRSSEREKKHSLPVNLF